MQSQPEPDVLPTNGRGKPVRHIIIYAPEKVIELSLQQFGDVWVPYKRVVHTIH